MPASPGAAVGEIVFDSAHAAAADRPVILVRPETNPDDLPGMIAALSMLQTMMLTALSVARTCSAHLTCLHVTPIEAYVAFDGFGGVFVMNDIIKDLHEEEQALRARVEKELRNEDVSWDYRQVYEVWIDTAAAPLSANVTSSSSRSVRSTP